MTSAHDMVVVELTNPTDGHLAVVLHLGDEGRTIATLGPGRSILLVSPPGASWEFVEAVAPTSSGDAPPEEGEGGRGRSMGQLAGTTDGGDGGAGDGGNGGDDGDDEDVAPGDDGGRGRSMGQ